VFVIALLVPGTHVLVGIKKGQLHHWTGYVVAADGLGIAIQPDEAQEAVVGDHDVRLILWPTVTAVRILAD
jgi:hypothetical protein